LFAALVSFFLRRRKPGTLVASLTQSDVAQTLEGMSWHEFEVLVGESFRLRGYKVTARGGGGADGGIDLVLRKDGETYLVQCKQWKAFKVGVEVVRELYGAMTANGAAGGFVVTSGTFTEAANELAHGRNITLVDGPQLFDMLRQGRRLLDETAPATVPAGSAGDSALPDFAVPHCPACQAAMVLRTARKGSKAGKQFWGCARFPDCVGTRELRAG
jgi:restriction system protein